MSAALLDERNNPQLAVGDVALLKSETWPGHAGASLVHRSSVAALDERRMLLTLDLVGD